MNDDQLQTIPIEPTLLPGDIVACWGTDPMSRFISLWTSLICLFKGPWRLKWAPSHVAIIGRYQGRLAWFESTSMCDHACLHKGEPAQGVQVHYPENRLADYLETGGRVAVYRLSPLAQRSVDTGMIEALLRVCLTSNLKYSFAAAGGSGTPIFRTGRLAPVVDFVDVYCGELISAVLQNVGVLRRCDPREHNPGRLMRELVRTGVYVHQKEYRS